MDSLTHEVFERVGEEKWRKFKKYGEYWNKIW